MPTDFDPSSNPMPALPDLEKYMQAQVGSPPSRGGDAGGLGPMGREPPRVDIRTLRDPNFAPEQCTSWGLDKDRGHGSVC